MAVKIRYVLHNAYGAGGTIRTVVNQANAMCETHEVEVVSVYRSREAPVFALDPRVRLVTLTDLREDGSRWTDPAGTNSRFWRKTRRFRTPLAHRHDFRYKRWDPLVDAAVIRYFRAQRDGVLVTTRPALNMLSAWFAPRKVVRVGQDHLNLGSYKPGLRAAILKAYPRLDVVGVLTRADLGEWEAALPGVRIVRVANGVPPRLGVPDGSDRSPTVLAAGRLNGQKGFDLLIEAFGQVHAEHPGWRLDIFGEGKLRARLTAQIEEAGLAGTVRLRGLTRNLDAELDKASVFALSSRREGLPMVLLEAMAAGLPAVAFDCPTGPREVVEDGVNGLLVPAEDVEALATGLSKLIGDAALRETMSHAAVATGGRYAMPEIAAQWESIFVELAGTRYPPPRPS
ncbi:hypothetical protein GCM10010435_90930 [Winogradskya consettensis]